MRYLAAALILSMAVLPAYPALAQSFDVQGTVSVAVTSDTPYIYKDKEGYTVVVGKVENKNVHTAISDVMVKAEFYNREGELVEAARALTLLDVIPSGGESPYIIRSVSADPGITTASVGVDGGAFNSSPPRPAGLAISVDRAVNIDMLEVSGTVANTGGVMSANTTVYVSFYDVFDPPRMLAVVSVPAGDIADGADGEFSLSLVPDSRAVSMELVAESDSLQSAPVTADIPEREVTSSIVSISGAVVRGADGAPARPVIPGSMVSIGSDLRFETIAEETTQPYTYYVQIKESGEAPRVVFVGAAEGAFYGTPDASPSVGWQAPPGGGLYFIETFVWDQRGVPIASKGPVSLVNVG